MNEYKISYGTISRILDNINEIQFHCKLVKSEMQILFPDALNVYKDCCNDDCDY